MHKSPFGVGSYYPLLFSFHFRNKSSRLFKYVTLPMRKRSAIQLKVIAISCRNRYAPPSFWDLYGRPRPVIERSSDHSTGRPFDGKKHS